MSNDQEHDLLLQALGLLDWVGRCVHMDGPAGTTVYFISDDVMKAIREIGKLNADL